MQFKDAPAVVSSHNTTTSEPSGSQFAQIGTFIVLLIATDTGEYDAKGFV